jgi:outer membrane protein assembly factor BamC
MMSEINNMNVNRIKQTVIALLLVGIFTGCSSIAALDEIVEDNGQKYQKATVLPPLDVPPGLSTARINDEFAEDDDGTTYTEYTDSADNPLAAKYNVAPSTTPALTGEGTARHLIVYGQADQLWERMIAFWSSKNIAVNRQDQTIGLLDTMEDEDGYAYRTRVEAGDVPNTSKMYISAAGFDSNKQKNEGKLRQLADYMGTIQRNERQQQTAVEQKSGPLAAITQINAVIVDEASDHQALKIDRNFEQVWRGVGRVIDSKYFVVQDRERDKGAYFVQYLDPFVLAKKTDDSMLSSLAFWRDEMDKTPELFYYIKLITDEADTKVIILDIDQVRTSSPSARRLLRLIQDELAQ